MITVPYTIRPIDTWPGEPTRDRRYSPFRGQAGRETPLSTTLDELDRELHHLGARNVVLQMAVAEKDIRLDGQLRANARPTHPGVILAFDSDHGPLKYAVDTFVTAVANLRAITLALESLRRVDRYGVTKRGEQYTGWKQIGSGTPMPAAMTLEEAADFIGEHSTMHEDGILSDPEILERAYRRAARKLHPDIGGTTEGFQRLQQARDLVEAHHA
jgi:hypothetical protein